MNNLTTRHNTLYGDSLAHRIFSSSENLEQRPRDSVIIASTYLSFRWSFTSSFISVLDSLSEVFQRIHSSSAVKLRDPKFTKTVLSSSYLNEQNTCYKHVCSHRLYTDSKRSDIKIV